MPLFVASELEAEVEVHVHLLGSVRIAQGGTQRTDDGVVVVGKLTAQHRLVLEHVLELRAMLCGGEPQKDVVIGEKLLLCL